MPKPLRHAKRPKAAPQGWYPNGDAKDAEPKDPPKVRAEKDRLIAAFLAKRAAAKP